MQRRNLVLVSGSALGVVIAAALPVIGRFVPGMGQGGGIALVALTVIGCVATPRKDRHLAMIISALCWSAFAFSAYSGHAGGTGHG